MNKLIALIAISMILGSIVLYAQEEPKVIDQETKNNQSEQNNKINNARQTDQSTQTDPADAQASQVNQTDQSNETNDKEEEKETSASLPSGYAGYNLGDTYDSVIERVTSDKNLLYEATESMKDREDRTFLEVAGVGFLKRIRFIFNDDKLYTIITEPNSNYIDFDMLSKTFHEKYGKPNTLNPSSFYWTNDSVQVSLEKPGYVKYMDKATFDKMKEAKSQDQTLLFENINQFLESF